MRNNQRGFQIIAEQPFCARTFEKANLLIARFLRPRIALLLCALVPMTFCFLLINGCSKSSGPTAPTLKGDPAFRAAAIAGYQSVGAGVSYPFTALQLASPTGSPIHSQSLPNLLSLLKHSASLKRASTATGTLIFVPELNLYTNGFIINGNVITMSYFSDSAGTQSAGNVVITLPTNITNVSDPTSYASYPVNVSIAINMTAGNIPCKGNIMISFTGGTGANSMTGTNTLTRDNVVFTLNLTLDNQMNASGSITVTESGATIQLTNVQGNPFLPLACDVKVNPYGWTGTGTLNLITGAMSVNINTGTGTSTAASDSLGDLDINYADGTHEIVFNALSGGLTGTSPTGTPASITATGGTPQSAAVNTAFASPLVATVEDASGNPLSGDTVTFTAPSTGQSGTFTGGVTTINQITNAQGEAQATITANGTAGSYDVTASVAGVTTTASFSLTNTSAPANTGYAAPIFFTSSQGTIVTINKNGQSIGYIPSTTGSNYNVPIYWSTPSSQPQDLQILTGDSSAVANGLNDNGQIVGYSYGEYFVNPELYYTSNALYWSSPTAKPQKLAVPANTYGGFALGINNSGQIVGYALSASNGIIPLYWPSPSDTPQVLAGSLTAAPGLISSNGQILGNYLPLELATKMTEVVWPSPTAQPVVLKGLTASAVVFLYYTNASGVIVGQSADTSGQTPVTWANANSSPQALPLPPSTPEFGFSYAAGINTAGVIVGGVSNGKGGSDCTVWKNGQVQDLAVLSGNYALGPAQVITDQGWILGGAYYGYSQYILIPK